MKIPFKKSVVLNLAKDQFSPLSPASHGTDPSIPLRSAPDDEWQIRYHSGAISPRRPHMRRAIRRAARTTRCPGARSAQEVAGKYPLRAALFPATCRRRRSDLIPLLFFLSLIIFVAIPLHATPLTPHTTRTSAQDLAVTLLQPDGTAAAPVYYTYEQLSTLPQVTVKTDQDPNTGKSATYTGVLVSDLFAAFGATMDQTVMTMTCYDNYQQYYDPAYDTKHQPILLLKFDGLRPADWPKSDQDTPQGPYSVVYGHFVPGETIYGYSESERIPFGVVSVRVLTAAQFFSGFEPKTNGTDPEVQKGLRIALGSCVSCHNVGDNGGAMAARPWSMLGLFAVSASDHFRSYVVNPQKINPTSKMPAHPTFDAKTLDALQAYFKTMAPQ